MSRNSHEIGFCFRVSNINTVSIPEFANEIKGVTWRLHKQLSHNFSACNLYMSIHRFVDMTRLPEAPVEPRVSLQDAMQAVQIGPKPDISEWLKDVCPEQVKPTALTANGQDSKLVIAVSTEQDIRTIPPMAFSTCGCFHMYRVGKAMLNDCAQPSTMATLLYIPIQFDESNLIDVLEPYCSHRTSIMLVSHAFQGNVTPYYHVAIAFETNKQARQFVRCMHGQTIIDSKGDGVQYMCIASFLAFCRVVDNEELIPVPGEQVHPRAVIEIPTCPECLATLDDSVFSLNTSGLTTVFSSSVNSHGPVCVATYVVNSFLASHCSECNETDDLWLCLICGNVACSRYKESHGIWHCNHTGHSLTLKLSTFGSGSPFAWDYLQDKCVQRLAEVGTQGKYGSSSVKPEVVTLKPEVRAGIVARAMAAIQIDDVDDMLTSSDNNESKTDSKADGGESKSQIQQKMDAYLKANEGLVATTDSSTKITAIMHKKLLTLIELNDMYTDALSQTDVVHEVMERNLEQTYLNIETDLEKQLTELNERYQNVAGNENAARRKLAKQRKQLADAEKALIDEKEMLRSMQANRDASAEILEKKRAKLKVEQQKLAKYTSEAASLMFQL